MQADTNYHHCSFYSSWKMNIRSVRVDVNVDGLMDKQTDEWTENWISQSRPAKSRHDKKKT